MASALSPVTAGDHLIASPRRRRRGTSSHGPRVRRLVASAASVMLAGTALAACTASNAATVSTATLNFYSFNDPSGAVATAVANCSKQSGGKYTITYNKLPAAADDQRLQMARRLAAADPTMDILGLDVTWAPEFAQAGWILPWTGSYEQQARAGTLKVPLETATWKNQLYAVPYNSNTQLLWYRDDLVKTPPATWDQMIADAEQLAKQGKPHLIEIQGAQYEGVTVWFNSLISSAGGSILTPDSSTAALGPPAVTALGIMKKLATSAAADPSLPVQMEDQNRLAMEAGNAAFEINYPFVYPSMKADNAELFKHFKWALYPRVSAGEPARVTIGGINLAVSKYSPHPDLAFQAALCLRDRENQLNAAIKGGLPPTLESLYHDPALFSAYPFHADILTSLQTASVRPKTPAYQTISIVISHHVSPPAAINPVGTEQAMIPEINNALVSKGVIP
jgi:multiple sugar transport system substrate-binding protein